ncbi:hypothetical protein D3C80_1446370 [compost metagenome]
MYCHIDFIGQHRLLNFLHEQSFAAYFGQGDIQNTVAFGNNFVHLKGEIEAMLRT